jgi:hypothetical protein
MNQPQIQEHPEWAQRYISQVDGNVIEVLTEQVTDFTNFINGLTAIADYAYAPGKWTIREMMGHIIDTERILVYRLMCFARNEKQALPGFEEDDYVANAHFADRSLASFCEEFALLRQSNLFLIKSLTDAELDRIGNGNGKNISVRALVFVIAGHVIHHTAVIKKRYL